MQFNDLRRDYRYNSLSRNQLASSPFDQFRIWFEEALTAGILEPNALSLATTSLKGKPSCRTVLMKNFDLHGLVFYTNYESRKSKEMKEIPFAAALFYWKELERQATIEGEMQQISFEEAQVYFSSRPRSSQIGAWSSKQSSVIPSRKCLAETFAHFDSLYKDQEIPVPPFWGGFRMIPTRFEFWQGRPDRLHDRFQYIQENGRWVIERLSP